jgi:hypothetical protein
VSTATLSSPAATGLFSRRSKMAPVRFVDEQPTQIWIGENPGSTVTNLSDFGDRLASLAATDGVSLVVRLVRDAGTVRISHSVDDDYALVLLGAARMTIDDEPSAVDAVLELKRRLGVSERVIEQATGISHSTLQYWKRNREAQPRAGSEGGLWTLISAVDDIDAHLGDSKTVAAWLKERPERVTALKAGRFRRLVDRETSVLRTAETAIITIEIDEAIGAAETPTAGPGEKKNADTESWALDGPAPRIVLD